ncbi:hypothetical protein HMI54_003604 [Coelomomyces lativittatus]|nr:hypothetical protein HMI55_007239 [Coelomomyces lativittatus]KAJ1517880.1 hypothetical protein HMI54_003604 [Coelomomyces lativittatus]
MDPNQFTNALHQALCTVATSQDNAQLQEVSQILNQQFYTNSQCVPSLLQIATAVNDIPVNIRQLAAIEARKHVKTYWKNLNAESQAWIKQKSLESALQESDARVQQGLIHIIDSICRKEIRKHKWGQLIDTLMNGCQSPEAKTREVSLRILKKVIDKIMMSYEENKVFPVLQLTATLLKDTSHAPNQLHALEALGSAATSIQSKKKAKAQFFQSLVPQCMQIVTDTLNDEALAKRSFEAMDCFLGSQCPILVPHFAPFVQFLVSTLSNPNLHVDVRMLAGNMLIILPLYKPKLLMKLNLVSPILEHTLPLSAATEYTNDANDDSPATIAYHIVNAYSTYLPAKQFYPMLMVKLMALAQDPAPLSRAAAIRCLGLAVEGCAELIRTSLDQLLPWLCQGLQETNISVRKSACEAIEQFLEKFDEEVAEYHAHLVPRLIECVQDAQVRFTATSALDTLLENMTSEVVAGYLPTLVNCLLTCMQDPDVHVQQQTVSALGSTAHCSGEAFQPYFPHVFPLVFHVLSLSNQDNAEEMLLRGIGIDTMSAIAQAVGPDTFRDHVSSVCPLIVESMHMKAPKLKECAFSFFGVLSSTFKREFSPFLSGLVPALLESVMAEEEDDIFEESTAPDGTSTQLADSSAPLRLHAGDDSGDSSDMDDDLDLDDDEYEDDDDDDDEHGGGNMLAEEKAAAIEVLGELFESTQQDFLPYLEEATQHILNQEQHYIDEVRKNVMITLLKFMEQYQLLSKLDPAASPNNTTSAVTNHPIPLPTPTQSSQFTIKIMDKVLSLLEMEEESFVLAEVLDSFQNILRSSSEKGYLIEQDPTHLDRLCQILLSIFNSQHLSQKTMDDASKLLDEPDQANGEYDEDEDAMDPLMMDRDLSAFLIACDLLSALCRALGPKMSNYVTVYLPDIIKRMTEINEEELSSVTGSLVDCCFGLQSGVNACAHLLLPVIQSALNHTNVDVKCNGVFGFGLLVQYCDAMPMDENTMVQHVLPCFQVTLPQCVDNTCGALARILLKKQILHPQLISTLLDHLPLRDDFSENEPVLAYLHFLLIQPNSFCAPYLPKIIHTVAHALLQPDERFTPELLQALLPVLRSFFLPVLQSGVQECVQVLPPEMQAALQKALYP